MNIYRKLLSFSAVHVVSCIFLAFPGFILIRLKRQVLMPQRSTWLWAIRTDMSADARAVLAVLDAFCALLGHALFPLFALLALFALFVLFVLLLCLVARCSRLRGHSAFAVARSLVFGECTVGWSSRLPGRSVFVVAVPLGVRGCSVAWCSRLIGRVLLAQVRKTNRNATIIAMQN